MLKSLVKLASKPSAALAVSKTCTIASVKLAPASLHWLRSVHAPVTVRSFSTTPKPDPAPTKAAPGSENSDSDFKDEPRNPKYDPARASSIQSRGMRIFFAFVAALGIGGYAYLDYLERQKGPAKVTSYQTAGEIKLGGPWSNLVDSEGKPASSDQYLGKYMLIYFGFTHCPDICPTEINKMMAALDKVRACVLTHSFLRTPIQWLLDLYHLLYPRLPVLLRSFPDVPPCPIFTSFQLYPHLLAYSRLLSPFPVSSLLPFLPLSTDPSHESRDLRPHQDGFYHRGPCPRHAAASA